MGDLARIDESGACPCGRDSGMILSAIEGRVASATFTLTGRLVTPRELDLALSKVEGIDEFRLDQLKADLYELHLASHRADREELTAEIEDVLKRLYGRGARVSAVYEEEIPPESSGKYCVSKSPFPVDIENYLDKS